MSYKETCREANCSLNTPGWVGKARGWGSTPLGAGKTGEFRFGTLFVFWGGPFSSTTLFHPFGAQLLENVLIPGQSRGVYQPINVTHFFVLPATTVVLPSQPLYGDASS